MPGDWADDNDTLPPAPSGGGSSGLVIGLIVLLLAGVAIVYSSKRQAWVVQYCSLPLPLTFILV